MIKITLLITLIAIAFCSCNNEKIIYPTSKKVEQTDTYFGEKVADPYRWLENDTSAETSKWVAEQNKVTYDYLNKIPFREKLKQRLTQLWDFPKSTIPSKENKKYLYYKNDGLQNQNVLYCKDSVTSTEKVLIDPNKFSADGTVSVPMVKVSKDGKIIAYAVSSSGSDWKEIWFKNIDTGEDLPDKLKWVKFSGIAWHNDGIFYSGYEPPEKGKELSQQNEYHKLYYHKLGTSQESDKIIIENKTESKRMFTASTIDSENLLVINEETQGKRGNALHVKKLSSDKNKIITVVKDFEYEFDIVEYTDGNLIARTNQNAPKYKLVKINFNNEAAVSMTDFISQTSNVLESCFIAGSSFVLKYMCDAHSELHTFDFSGKNTGVISLPGIGSVSAFSGKKNDNEAYFTYTSFTTPGDHYKLNMTTMKYELFMSSKIKFNSNDYETVQVLYKSKDGTKIPMFITHKKGVKKDGSNPTLLYGYGGFNVSLTPDFKVPYAAWFEQGGIYAVANLRGGGEYGREWHEAGTKLKKQNVFDDFIAAAEYLISEKYTSPEKLAIRGGSNGGLLVGAVINQRPELFAAAQPAVGVMDMLRFQKFTIGWNWTTDYGSSENKAEFKYIYKYSPIHNIKENTKYPAVLVTTADHDDRVVPAHSFKYIATLQEKYKGNNPVLIRIETKAGHGAGKSTSQLIEEYTDVFSFLWFNLKHSPEL